MNFELTQEEALEINRMCNLLHYSEIRKSIQDKIVHQIVVNDEIEEEAKK